MNLTNQIQIQIFYEISMAIGGSLDLQQMLKASISAYLRKLSCSAGMVLEQQPEGQAAVRFVPRFTIPRNARRTAGGRAMLDRIPSSLTRDAHEAFLTSLPLETPLVGDRRLHLFELPGFGLLALAKSGMKLDRSALHSIRNLNAKLAESCIACRQSEQLRQVLERLEATVEERTRELQRALDNVKTLSGLLPICSHCKKVRDDSGYWSQIDAYVSLHSDAQFSHGICPECIDELYPGLMNDEE